MLESIFQSIGLEREHVQLYLHLTEGGPSQASALSKKLHLPRASLYNLLYDLRDKDLVTQATRKGIKVWQANSPKNIQTNIDVQINNLERAKDNLSDIVKALEEKQKKDFINPTFKSFEGADGMRQMMSDILLYRDVQAEAFWPAKEMVEVLGTDFFTYFNNMRIRQNISFRAIWPAASVVKLKEYPFFGVGKEFKREIRIAPTGIEYSMGYWAYQNKVAFISSKRESFGFIVESLELRQLLKTQFEAFWQKSKPMKISAEDEKQSKKFLEKLHL